MVEVISEGTSARPTPSANALRLIRNAAIVCAGVALPVPFLATSLLRIVTLSMIGIAIGLAFGIANVWLVILGLGISQVVLAAAALRESMRFK